MLPAIDLHEHFIDIEGVSVASMFAFESFRVESTELDTPKPDGFVADCDTPLGKEIFNVSMAEVESVVQPGRIADDIGWEPVTLVGIHRPILPISAS